MNRKPNRREFLLGHAAADALADRLEAASAGWAAGEGCLSAPSGYMLRVSRRAMACIFEVCLNAGQYAEGTKAALDALELVGELEEQMSVFRPQSEIAQINRTAGRQPVGVEPRLFELIEMAVQLHAETEGAFDITSGPLWEVWGFSRRRGNLPSQQAIDQARRRVGSELLELQSEQRTIRFRQSGVQLNLGSIGKGYALDRCAELLAERGIGDFLLHAGHSSMLARGSLVPTPGADSPSPRCAAEHGQSASGWPVGIRHPLRPDRRVAEFSLHDRALGTSGGTFQSFMHQGRRYSHLIDPRTGRPAEGVLSATVFAPTAALADALATAFFIMGPDKTAAYCQAHPEVAAVLICPARHSGGIEWHTFGLEETELRKFGPPAL